MSRSAGHLAAAAAQPVPGSLDWRIERMAALVEGVPLGEEWDPARLLVVPRPGGLLCPYEACTAPGCSSLVDGASRLCRAHGRQFAASGLDDLDAWVAAGGPRPPRRRYLSEECCAVTGAAGRCPRPATGAARLCHAHSTTWATRCRSGGALQEFMATAQPLESLGMCAVASCYLEAAYKQTRLCEMHYHVWSRQGRPPARRFEAFLHRAAQPANARVLSLRGLPELVRLELLFVIGCLVREQVHARPGDMRSYVDRLREHGVASLIELMPATIDPTGRAGHGRFPRFAFDRVRLAYANPGTERGGDRWDLRVFGRTGNLDFSAIRQPWLRDAAKSWAHAALGGPGAAARSKVSTVQHQLHSVALLSATLASGPGGGTDPTALGRGDVERFLARAASFTTGRTGRPYSPGHAATVVRDCALVLRDSRDMGLLATLAPTFAIRRNDAALRVPDDKEGRALPAHVVDQLDAHLNLLRATPGSNGGPAHRSLGALGGRAGEAAVLAYEILKGTGRRAGEVASLHLECLDVDEHGRPVLIYDNHKAQRMGRRLPLGNTALVEAIRAQQAWVAERFAGTARDQLWLLPRTMKNADGTAHLRAELIFRWMKAWVARIPRLDAGTVDGSGEPVPFDRSAVHPHAFRHTYVIPGGSNPVRDVSHEGRGTRASRISCTCEGPNVCSVHERVFPLVVAVVDLPGRTGSVAAGRERAVGRGRRGAGPTPGGERLPALPAGSQPFTSHRAGLRRASGGLLGMVRGRGCRLALDQLGGAGPLQALGGGEPLARGTAVRLDGKRAAHRGVRVAAVLRQDGADRAGGGRTAV